MSKKMKVLVTVLAAVVLLAAGISTAVLADDGEEEPITGPGVGIEAGDNGLLARVAEILKIDKDALVAAFEQAQREMAVERLASRLQKAIDADKISREQADEILVWYQQRPEIVDSPFFRQAFGPPGLRGPNLGRRIQGAFRRGLSRIRPPAEPE